MSDPSERITKFLILFVLAVLIVKNAGNAGFFQPKSHSGPGFYVKIPTGWHIVPAKKGTVLPQDVEIVRFVPEGVDPQAERPDVYISIITKKLTTPIWIEDEFPEIVTSITRSGMEVKDKGEIKIDDKVSKWVVYYDKKAPALVLEFYMVTDNNIFQKIQYSALPDKFNVYRPSFEELKNSFKFRMSLY